MKRILYVILVLLLLCGCAESDNDAVQISILEADGFTVENNGQWVRPGEDAVFRLAMEPGLTVAGTDHPGGHSLRMDGGILELTLKAATYPARIRLQLTDRFTTVTYSPNGGDGQETTLVYDLTHHARPNTEIDLFSREGHTLESWNTAPDGSGIRVGLGSRVAGGETLYAQWEKWSDISDFTYTAGVDITITGYHGAGDTIVIPALIDGKNVAAIGYDAFQNVRAKGLILPVTMKHVAQGAFRNCAFESVTLFDSIENISDDSFRNCPNLKTVQINAAQPPFGYGWRKESCYADKIELLVAAAGQKKLVCYGGCAMWYNLDGAQMQAAFSDFAVINLGLNGVVNSAIQMQIMGAFLEEGDILFHTPELTSSPQMMRSVTMDADDDKLWCGLENNYDLVRLVEFGTVPGLLDSFCDYLQKKDGVSDHSEIYTDSLGRSYLDTWGCIPFERTETHEMLSDKVELDPESLNSLEELGQSYGAIAAKGVRIYVGYACVNLDALPEAQRSNAALVDQLFREAVHGAVVISDLDDYLYRNDDFYDTNYHLRSDAAARNTALWIRDLREEMEADA
ncbi:MAG: leucine-rich repeat protein [Oscillospiraceae bacterium]|nr:leucine-rich repeat protein [Oscillospiraceae bacterium]